MKSAIQLSWPDFKPAKVPDKRKAETKCLSLFNGNLEHRNVSEIPSLLDPGDLIVVNDAATLPALFSARLSNGEKIEIRLIKAEREPHLWWAVLLGAGTWRLPTEERTNLPEIEDGEVVTIGFDFKAKITRKLFGSKRLVEMKFISENVWSGIYKYGRPIQYSYLERSLELWDPQTIFSGPPVAFEAPSAAFCLTWKLVDEFRRRDIEVASLTHSTGVSSLGEPALDRLLPFDEPCQIPQSTVDAIRRARQNRSRVIAFGTGTVRALEGSPFLKSGRFDVRLRMGRNHKLRVVSGLLTGLHDRTTSHLEMLEAFISADRLHAAYSEASRKGYKAHEFGDVNLIVDDNLRSW
jgi:S-adenosylmethionine:tRNA ribosyltransferase-isomerase